ncbi:ABC transporter substrate-binding protein [Gilvibacter sp.]|uniref:ABC transporter substrate-binding protein n=1 Tax=Gilvibacter sp. TaxID=2729997 RepID=UPI003B5206E1
MRKTLTLLLAVCFLLACKNESSSEQSDRIVDTQQIQNSVTHATGFRLYHYSDYSILEVDNPWPEADRTFRYLLYSQRAMPLQDAAENFDAVITVPVRSLVVTSTTHIPSLEALNAEELLLGFPQTDYVSSAKTRALIDAGKVKELGGTQQLNLELLIDAAPDVVVGFGVDGDNKTLDRVQEAGIPVVYNGDWVEQDPLGKAEWLKFFGALLDKNEQATTAFNKIAEEYSRVKALAQNQSDTPTVLSGAMYKDVWYLPNGQSWAAQFLRDAKADYRYADTQGKGSLSLSIESVLEKSQDAAFWIGPGQFTSLTQMAEANAIYAEFAAFKAGEVYSFTTNKGPTGGVIYYELAPNRPDLVLKDLIRILHPELLPEHELYFFSKLE